MTETAMPSGSGPPATDASSRVDRDRGSSFATELSRDRAAREHARTLKPLRRLIPFILRYPWLLAAFVVFLALASTLTLVLPAAFRLLIDCGFGGAPDTAACAAFAGGDSLDRYFWIGMVVAGALAMAGALRFYFISRLGERVVADLRIAVYDHILGLSPVSFATTKTGEVLSRLTTDTTLIQTVVGSSISVAIRTTATTLGAIVLMLVVNWKLAAMVLAIGPVIIGPILLCGQRLQRLSRASQDSLADASARASETLRAVETVQAFTREDTERARFAQAVETKFDVSLRRIRVEAVMMATMFSAITISLICGLWYGALQVQSGAITPGTMTQFIMYAFVAVSGVMMLTETYAEIMRAAGATERLMELLSTEPAITAPAIPRTLARPVKGALAFDDVHFAYPLRPDTEALKGISFSVEAGETVALVGPSGAGKSTVFQLLLRLYDPQSGQITFDGQNVRHLDPERLRQHLAIVQQNAPLFSGSAAENIRFGRPGATAADVRAAARAANAHRFIAELPEGYETQIGEGGATLSGGQRQRIAIARAVLRDAPVLLLDEATSSLDSESERAIQDAFEALSKNRTTLVIAHRLATVLKADRIIVLENGQIIDEGPHADLLSRGGLYARLVELQFGALER